MSSIEGGNGSNGNVMVDGMNLWKFKKNIYTGEQTAKGKADG